MPASSARVSVVGLPDSPTSWFAVSGGHLVDFAAERVAACLSTYTETPPHPLRHLRHTGRSAPVARLLHHCRRRRPSSPGSSVLLLGPSPGCLRQRQVPSEVLARSGFGIAVPPALLLPSSWFVHLDGLLRCRPPTCCSRRRVWGSSGWLRVGRWRSACPLAKALGPPRVGAGWTHSRLPSKVQISSGSRWASPPHLSPPAVPPSLVRRIAPAPRADCRTTDRSVFPSLPASGLPEVRGSTRKVPCHRSGRVPWVVRACPFASGWRFFHSGRSLRRSTLQDESCFIAVGELPGVSRSGCPGLEGRQLVPVVPSSFFVPRMASRLSDSRRVSTCGPRCLAPHTTWKLLSWLARSPPCPPITRSDLFGIELSWSLCHPRG